MHFVESMGGIRAVQAFRREPRNQEIFDDVNDQYRRGQPGRLPAGRVVHARHPADRQRHHRVVLIYGGYRAYHGDVTVGVLAAFLLYLRQFFEPMMEISQFYNTFQSASAALDKLAGVLEEEPSVPEPTDPVALIGGVGGELRFDHVGFEYVDGRTGAARPRPHRARRADARPGRHHRRRQDHAGQAGHPLLRPDRGPGAARRRRPARPALRRTCATRS